MLHWSTGHLTATCSGRSAYPPRWEPVPISSARSWRTRPSRRPAVLTSKDGFWRAPPPSFSTTTSSPTLPATTVKAAATWTRTAAGARTPTRTTTRTTTATRRRRRRQRRRRQRRRRQRRRRQRRRRQRRRRQRRQRRWQWQWGQRQRRRRRQRRQRRWQWQWGQRQRRLEGQRRSEGQPANWPGGHHRDGDQPPLSPAVDDGRTRSFWRNRGRGARVAAQARALVTADAQRPQAHHADATHWASEICRAGAGGAARHARRTRFSMGHHQCWISVNVAR